MRTFNAIPEAVSTAHRGTQGELLVCCDLLGKGYDVYRSVSPSAKCDLVAIKPGVILRIEVRTGTIYPANGRISYGTERLTPEFTDLVAVVLRGKDILYLNCDQVEVVV
jgi:PD-(D/E)XK nuclease superfamily protein